MSLGEEETAAPSQNPHGRTTRNYRCPVYPAFIWVQSNLIEAGPDTICTSTQVQMWLQTPVALSVMLHADVFLRDQAKAGT